MVIYYCNSAFIALVKKILTILKEGFTMKKVISLLLAIMLTVLCAVPAFAATDDSNLNEEAKQLYLYICKLKKEYGIENDPGECILSYSVNSVNLLNNDISKAEKLLEEYFYYKTVTKEQFEEAFDILKADEAKMCVRKTELSTLISICSREVNNNYYSDEIWDSFQEALRTSRLTLENSSDDYEIDSEYWNLRFSFNKICGYNQVVGDVNGDGKVTVVDATLYSKAIAGMYTLNSSQKLVSSIDASYLPLSVLNVTAIQKHLAGYERYETIRSSENLETLCSDFYSRDVYSNMIYKYARFNAYLEH